MKEFGFYPGSLCERNGTEFEMLSVLVSDISVNVLHVRRPTDV